ncbi:MAG: MFS transporter, partial [Candidatus Diapherotrites archaeon]|nr:MFS transporter [Candidatus Diapherotrites archaeon]
MFERIHNVLSEDAAVAKLASSGFFDDLSAAVIDVVWALMLFEYLKNEAAVGALQAIFNFIAVVLTIGVIPYVESHYKLGLYRIVLAAAVFIYFIYGLQPHFLLFLFATILLMAANAIGFEVYAVLVRRNTSASRLNSSMGIVYTSSNLAYLVGPLIGGFLLQNHGMMNVFFFAAFMSAAAYIAVHFI